MNWVHRNLWFFSVVTVTTLGISCRSFGYQGGLAYGVAAVVQAAGGIVEPIAKSATDKHVADRRAETDQLGERLNYLDEVNKANLSAQTTMFNTMVAKETVESNNATNLALLKEQLDAQLDGKREERAAADRAGQRDLRFKLAALEFDFAAQQLQRRYQMMTYLIQNGVNTAANTSPSRTIPSQPNVATVPGPAVAQAGPPLLSEVNAARALRSRSFAPRSTSRRSVADDGLVRHQPSVRGIPSISGAPAFVGSGHGHNHTH